MAQFYKELKELRESREISLEEISERTKINVQYLIAIEEGDFSDIENTLFAAISEGLRRRNWRRFAKGIRTIGFIYGY